MAAGILPDSVVLIAVAAIDFVSGRLRAAMAGRKSAPG
jgi:hypothetical protein